MLLNFTVENCLSFKSEQEFTMLRKDRHGTQEEQGHGVGFPPLPSSMAIMQRAS
ncbi:hypothetical protein [Bifidobacterium breve]|uniref:hypothetical protein n=1 Tax=Bifidobacterium breve TaxID=1685 RepID=UPI00374E9248